MATGVSTFSGISIGKPSHADMLFLICEEVETCCLTAELGIIAASLTRKESHSPNTIHPSVGGSGFHSRSKLSGRKSNIEDY
jgi:hypothetical protein